MSDYKAKEGTGQLFINSFKEPGSKQPDFRGEVLYQGKKLEISGWRKKDTKGREFFGLAVKPAREEQTVKVDDDVPF